MINKAQLTGLKAVFGNHVPKDEQAAVRMLEQSPAAPSSPAELQALREALSEVCGQNLDELKASAASLKGGHPVGTGQRATPAGLSVQLGQMTGANAVGSSSTDGLTRVLSPARVQELFDLVANDDTIPHKFIDEGCHFRSTLVAKQLEEQGAFSEKIVLNPDACDLKINSAYSKVGFTLAIFHMATSVWMDAGQGPERRVLDPSLGDKPLTVDEWSAKMEGLNGKSCSVSFVPRFVGHPMDRDEPPSTWKPEDLDDAKAWTTQYKEVQDQMEQMGFYEHLVEMEEQGRRVASADPLVGPDGDGA